MRKFEHQPILALTLPVMAFFNCNLMAHTKTRMHHAHALYRRLVLNEMPHRRTNSLFPPSNTAYSIINCCRGGATVEQSVQDTLDEAWAEAEAEGGVSLCIPSPVGVDTCA